MNISALYQLFKKSNGVTTDSRNCPEGSIFFALRGDSFNGNQYAAQALEKGCAYAVVDDSNYHNPQDNRYLFTHDVLHTLQLLAHHHRKELKTKVIGITGTNGKTTTKELIAAVLSQAFNVLYTQGNLNNHIGVPLTLLNIQPQHEIAVIEMGANHPGEIKQLAEITDPDYGIITNVGKAHLEGFGSFEGVINTKGELYNYLRAKENAVVFINQENHYLTHIATGLNLVAYGTTPGLFVSGQASENSTFLEFDWQAGQDTERYHVATRLIGDYNLTNALAAIAIGRYMGVDSVAINEALAAYKPQNNRSQLTRTERNTLIIDAYNANPTSMKAAIENFRKINLPHKMVILGDMRELGNESDMEHQRIVELLQESAFEETILIGELFAATRHPYQSYKHVDDYIAAIETSKPSGKTILIKGSNGIRLNKVLGYL
ncbi:UDP-N-acetylmuramoyl-tripeptide--D-alanyl-D-alanine ligase [Bacteroides sp. OttesenSCG-928-N06]|nr:UDP-N-acetylmuramoyl-tripeptide--D-alanyl-D-alanine ligase [Bacteroides sp. OttesenSCG-928-N06]